MKIYEVTTHKGSHGFKGETSTTFMKGNSTSEVQIKATEFANVKSVKLRKDMSISDFEENEFGELKYKTPKL